LNQTSGLSPLKADTYLYTGDVGAGVLEREVRALRTVELAYPPGQTWQYCNMNYTILGLIVQTIAGEPYERYVQEQILAPLGMRNSFASPGDAQRHGLATGYQLWFGRPVASTLFYNRAAVPSGYISSSAEDMAYYLIAQLNAGRYGNVRLLSAAGIDELHKPAASTGGPGQNYAMGWMAEELSGVPTLWHNGNTLDFHAHMILVPKSQQGIVLMVNGNDNLQFGHLNMIARSVLNLLLGQQPPPLPRYDLEMLVVMLAGLGACILQIFGMLRSVVLLRRWHAQPERRPRGVRGVALRVGLPLALNLPWALLCLVVVPQVFETPLAGLLFSDVGLVVVVSGAVALVWGVLRAVLAFLVLRAQAAPKAAVAPATA
jgi:CubicO group peptidase (beta-lactamase class C family)